MYFFSGMWASIISEFSLVCHVRNFIYSQGRLMCIYKCTHPHRHTHTRTEQSCACCVLLPLPPQHLSLPFFVPPCPLLFPPASSLLPASSVSSSYPGESHTHRCAVREKEREQGRGGEGRQDLEFKCTCRK